MPAFIVFLLVCLIPFSSAIPIIPGASEVGAWRASLAPGASGACAGLSLLDVTAILALIATGTAAIRKNQRFDTLDWAALAWCAAWFASALAAPERYEAALSSAARIAAGGILFVFVRSALDDRSRGRLMLLFALTGALAAALAIVSTHLPGIPLNGIFVANAPAPASLAMLALGAFLVITFPLALVAGGERSSPFGKAVSGFAAGGGARRTYWPVSWAPALVIAAGILFTGTRGTWAAAAVAALTTLLVGRKHFKRIGTAGIVMAVIILTGASLILSASLRHRVLDRTDGSRIESLRAEWLAFRARPALGFGPGQLAGNQPGSLYTRTLAEGGIPAAAVLAIIMGAALFRRNGKPGRTATAENPAARGLVAGGLAFGLFSPVLLSAGTGLAFWIALALCAARTPAPSSPAR